ncbi:MAG TPA: Gfo/Idh/MocA family oxidoreductase [Opitutaceae bacterium]|nr:Gfo/Idh/MocA family oxidoreductase [Opitutaceae bacterium]
MKQSPQPGRPPAKTTLKDFQVSRRTFLGRLAAAAALTGLPAWFLERQELAGAEAPGAPSPNDRPGIALVGCGGMGKGDATNAANHGEIVAVCDVDAAHAAEAAAKFTVGGKAPAQYSDFRRVLERPDVHAIVNATPDHWHSLINIAAAKAGKDVYSEKPLTLTIDEGRHVVEAVKRHGIVLQTGTQQRSSQRFRLACELVRNGRIGGLRRAEIWLPAGLREGPFRSAPVPSGLDWDFWLGQAPKADYVPQRCHTYFRYWYEYSGGTMTDWGAHHIDIASWAIGLPAPRQVEGQGLADPIPGGYTTFSEYEVSFLYENGVAIHVRTTTDDNIFGEKVKADGQRNGIRFVGDSGWIWVNRSQITASDPELLRAPLPSGAIRLPVSNNHMGNFFDCVRSRQPPICDVETGHRSATLCHLGAIALRTGRRLLWDHGAEEFVGPHAREANHYVSRRMRGPFTYGFGG